MYDAMHYFFHHGNMKYAPAYVRWMKVKIETSANQTFSQSKQRLHTYIRKHTHTQTHTRTPTHILSNGANGLISYGDMIIIHTYTPHTHTPYPTHSYTHVHTHTHRPPARTHAARSKLHVFAFKG